MSGASELLLKMLDKALEMEKKGKAFYDEAVETCQNEMGREIFLTLRKDEDIHIARIVDIYNRINEGGQWGSDWKKMEFSHGDLTAFFSGLAERYGVQATADAGDISALEVGIDFELRSVAFYEEGLKNAADANEREFIERMIVEEKDHHKILEDTKLYLTDPASWFREHERGGLDGA